MRINLAVPYEDKDQAKRLGARWDAARRVWYLIDPEDLAPFAQWMRGVTPQVKPRRDSSPPVTIKGPRYQPACNCLPPWEECEHTAPELEGEHVAHLRSILALG